MTQGRVRIPSGWMVACVVLLGCTSPPSAFSQRGNPISGTQPGALPLVNDGGGPMESQFESMDFAQIILQQQNKKPSPREQERQKGLIDSGAVSALDLAAPARAVNEFNQASSMLRSQQSQEAIGHLQKAIAVYPKFVSAHNYLGLAYLDVDDAARARSEFETAASLDQKFAGSFLNLGRLALSQNNYVTAGSNLEKAATLLPNDPRILTALAYAQNGNHQYQEAIHTVGRVHALQHKGMGNAHYVAAVAAVALNDLPVAQSELALFLQEDPTNPLAASAHYNLDVLGRNQQKTGQVPSPSAQQRTTTLVASASQSLANSDRLKAQLAGVGDEAGGPNCSDCADPNTAAVTASLTAPDVATGPPDQWTIRKVVDEVAVFFGVTSGGHTVTDLAIGDITVRDDRKPPEKVLQFTPQSKLPMRLGLLIDTSGSVQSRFS